MASPISCLSILVIPLLVTSLFYHVSNADRTLIESKCENSTNNSFCLSALVLDPQSSTSNLYMLGIITIDLNLKVFEEADSRIPNLLDSLTDSLDRSQLSNCQTNLTDAHETMKAARNTAGEQSYMEESNLLLVVFSNISHCKSQYEDPLICESPISDLTSQMMDLFNISSVIIAMIDSS